MTTARGAIHAAFTIERFYPVAPARVFAAWADPASKAEWFACDASWVRGEHALDFRVGGRESLRIGPRGGPVHGFDAIYHDIVRGERIVYAYTMRMDETVISVSLATIELHADAGGTRMVFTEQGAFLDGHQPPAEREEGTRVGLASLEAFLRRDRARN